MKFSRLFQSSQTRALDHAEAFALVLKPIYAQAISPAKLPLAHADTLKTITVRASTPGLCTTEAGFVVMSVRLQAAVNIAGVTALPGCDDAGNTGWLIIGASLWPFHSRAENAATAVSEALISQVKAQRLEDFFGGKNHMREAINAAPWWRWCLLKDAHDCGLCAWGIERFLRRFRLWHAVNLLGGLPKFAFSCGGSYARRAVAQALMRNAITKATTAPHPASAASCFHSPTKCETLSLPRV